MAENNCLEKKNLKKKGLVGSHSAAFYFFRFSGGVGFPLFLCYVGCMQHLFLAQTLVARAGAAPQAQSLF
jgi:hypothetical protein